MKKTLCFICPDCHLEQFITNKYGENIFFATALGAVFNFDDINFSKSLNDLIVRESITEIFIINDTSCRFINDVLNKGEGFGSCSEYALNKLLICNNSIAANNETIIFKKKALAELNIKRQINEIRKDKIFLPQNIENKINIKGIVFTKAENIAIELN
ncbi:MAG: hypothetical protein Q7W45_15650 [Bacteroidota bacterium]|nr:hypothetical protein [Bacteroidota bacterium]MDP3145551.1 hypothetical protein [Bacteroidota bacterium]MDP3557981.1 hypothetical protein [Bacteroidota bacterium]